QARWRHSNGKAVARLAGVDERGAGQFVDDCRALPLRCERHARGHRTLTGASRHGALFGGVSPSHGLARNDLLQNVGIQSERMSIVEKFMTMEYGPAPEDPREALAWLDRSQRRFGHFVGGEWHVPVVGTYFETTDPSTGEKLATVAQGSAE